MLKKLILKEWFRFFFSSVAVLFLLLTVANLISGFLRGNVTPVEVLFNYLIEIPGFLLKIFPVSCLTASLFSINKLKNRNELTAIFASGFSTKKYFITLVQASAVVAIAQLLMGGLIQPKTRSYRDALIVNSDNKFRNLKAKGLRTSTIGTGKIWFKSGDYFFSFSSFDKVKGVLNNVTLYFFSDSFKLVRKIDSPKLTYQETGGWMAISPTIYSEADKKGGFPIVEKKDFYHVDIKENLGDFKKIESDITTLGLVSLYLYINRLSESGINTNEYLVMFLDKIASSLVCIILALVAAVAIYSPNRRTSSFGKNLGMVFLLTLVYWLAYDYSLELGRSSKVNPYLACFSLPSLFMIYVIYQFKTNQKLK